MKPAEKRDRIADDLAARIIGGTLPPGTRLRPGREGGTG